MNKVLDEESKDNLLGEIKKLREENAKRRVRCNELIQENDKIRKSYSDLYNEHRNSKNEYEKFNDYVPPKTLEFLKRSFNEEKESLLGQVASLQTELRKERVLRDAHSRISDAGYKFKNEAERLGFDVTLTNALCSDADVNSVIDKFVEANRDPAHIPGNSNAPVKKDFKADLLRMMNEKRDDKLGREDIARLLELERQIESH